MPFKNQKTCWTGEEISTVVVAAKLVFGPGLKGGGLGGGCCLIIGGGGWPWLIVGGSGLITGFGVKLPG